ncbi:hypothetical protein Tsubulata_025158, partial [Turnera subulata]
WLHSLPSRDSLSSILFFSFLFCFLFYFFILQIGGDPSMLFSVIFFCYIFQISVSCYRKALPPGKQTPTRVGVGQKSYQSHNPTPVLVAYMVMANPTQESLGPFCFQFVVCFGGLRISVQ